MHVHTYVRTYMPVCIHASMHPSIHIHVEVFILDMGNPWKFNWQSLGNMFYFWAGLGRKSKDFGCAWYKLWMRKTLQAVEKDCDLIVVTKEDGSLGTSQQAEARFLEQSGHVYCHMNIREFPLGAFNSFLMFPFTCPGFVCVRVIC